MSEQEQKFITVYSPYLPPYPLSVAGRMSHFIEALEESNYIVNIITGKKAYWGKSLLFDLPSRQPGFAMSMLRETLSGIELAIRMITMNEPCTLISSPPLVTAFLGAWGAHMTKKFYFLDVRDLQPDLYFRSGSVKRDSFVEKILLKMERWLYKHAAVIFTSSQRICDDILSRHPSVQGRVFSIWNGFDEAKFVDFSEKPDQFKILYHGNFGPLNNISLLRKVAQELKAANINVQIDCAGVGPSVALIKAAKLDNLKVIPPIKTEELCKTISGYHLALSLRNDGKMSENDFPSKVFECIGAGVPVLMTPKSEGGKFVSDSYAGFQFDNKDGQQVIDAIKSFSANPENLRKLNENAMKLREELGRRKLRSALVQVLDQL